MEIVKNTKIDFIGKRYIAYLLSTVLVISGIVGLTQIYRKKANLSIDFVGGGLILSSSNTIHRGVKPENFVAMVEAARKYGKYPLQA